MNACLAYPTPLPFVPEPLRSSRMTPGAIMAALFDEIECGLIVCDTEGAIHVANRAAQQELEAQRLLVRQGERLACAPGVRGELHLALRQAVQRARRTLVRLEGNDDRLLVSVMPLRLPDVEVNCVQVMLGRRQVCSELGLELLAMSHGLTLAERRVLGALVREASPREIAKAHDVALSTVRTQIASIRAKLGARSIDGLLLHAAGVPPVASALRRPVPVATNERTRAFAPQP